jgi:hypothetical protein
VANFNSRWAFILYQVIFMSPEELKEILRLCLGDIMEKKRGQTLYSGIDTVKPGKFYFLGFNPAADGTNPLLYRVPLDRQGWSAYTHQCWFCGASAGCCKAGKKQHQRRVVQLMNELNMKPEKTFASNLIFVESRTAAEVNEPVFIEKCWCVHKLLLAKVRPTYIICLGNGETVSAFSVLREIADSKGETTSEGQFKKFKGKFSLNGQSPLEPTVVGVRHPSRHMNPAGLAKFIGIKSESEMKLS